jgi:hypothetical protein
MGQLQGVFCADLWVIQNPSPRWLPSSSRDRFSIFVFIFFFSSRYLRFLSFCIHFIRFDFFWVDRDFYFIYILIFSFHFLSSFILFFMGVPSHVSRSVGLYACAHSNLIRFIPFIYLISSYPMAIPPGESLLLTTLLLSFSGWWTIMTVVV